MKTPDESKCGMECIRTNVERLCIKPEKGQCPRCKQLVDDSIAYIQQLESRLAQAERERDAAVADWKRSRLKGEAMCWTCKFCEDGSPCLSPIPCEDGECWQWRGVCEENTKEE